MSRPTARKPADFPRARVWEINPVRVLSERETGKAARTGEEGGGGEDATQTARAQDTAVGPERAGAGPGEARAGPAAGRMERSAARGSGAAQAEGAAATAVAARSLTPTPARGRRAAPP